MMVGQTELLNKVFNFQLGFGFNLETRLYMAPFHHDKQSCSICNCSHLNYWVLQTVILSGRTTVTITDTFSSPLDAFFGNFSILFIPVAHWKSCPEVAGNK